MPQFNTFECFYTFANFDLSLHFGGFCVIRPRWWVTRALEVPLSCLKRFKCQGKDKGRDKERGRQKMKGTCRQKEKNEGHTERGFFDIKWHMLRKWGREMTQIETGRKVVSKISVRQQLATTAASHVLSYHQCHLQPFYKKVGSQ